MTGVTIVDYGVGNLGSVGRALGRIGVEYELTHDTDAVGRSRKLVLPGVGHFGESMTNLRERGLDRSIRDALDSGAAILGICVGFQMLFERSEEAPGAAGLGLLRGDVRRFASGAPVPHIGWNQLEDVREEPLLAGVDEGDYFYFLHSYYVEPSSIDTTWATTSYGAPFCAVAGRGPVSGIQFHPEKSQKLGLRVLSNFCGAPAP